MLSLKPFVWTGLISYSLYLWHQPLIVFQRLAFYAKPYMDEYIALSIIASFILSYFTWKYVENPLRNKTRIGRKQVFFGALFTSLILIGFGIGGSVSDGYPGRLSLISPAAADFIKPPKTNNLDVCVDRQSILVPGVSGCKFGALDTEPQVLIWGDSHADALYSVLDARFNDRKMGGQYVKAGACGVLPGLAKRSSAKACDEAIQNLLTYIKSSSVSHIVVVLRWSVWLYPYPGIDSYGYNNSEGGIEYQPSHPSLVDSSYETHGQNEKGAAVKKLIADFVSTEKITVLSYETPGVGWDATKVALSSLIRGQMDLVHSTDYTAYKSRTEYIHGLLDDLGDIDNLIRVRPEQFFCNTVIKDRCVFIVKGETLYYDDDHLSNSGAKKVVNKIMRIF